MVTGMKFELLNIHCLFVAGKKKVFSLKICTGLVLTNQIFYCFSSCRWQISVQMMHIFTRNGYFLSAVNRFSLCKFVLNSSLTSHSSALWQSSYGTHHLTFPLCPIVFFFPSPFPLPHFKKKILFIQFLLAGPQSISIKFSISSGSKKHHRSLHPNCITIIIQRLTVEQCYCMG